MSIIDEVKQRADIVEVVSEYVPGLKKVGRNFKALCPFHSEKTASFHVFPERQSWHCFGACATGGDVFSFVMKKEGVDFGEALRFLAGKAGIPLTPGPADRDDSEVRRLAEANEAAAAYYQHLLLQTPGAEKVRDYLVQRGLNQKSIEDFQLGLSPGGWTGLRDYLAGKGYAEKELIASGLVIEKGTEGGYDRFRNRLMFPIRGATGMVLAFGARALDDSSPKYLNSSQTILFDKSAVLYGLYQAREAIRKEGLAVVVEGYMDVIATHQHGFRNVVASMGTSFTEKQAGILKKLAKNLIFALDADTAGAVATERGIEVAAGAYDQRVMPVLTPSGGVRYENVLDAEVKVLVLPSGKDPDQIVRENPQRWQKLVEEALPVVDYTIGVVTAGLDLTRPKDKSEAVRKLQPILEAIKDPVRRGHYVQRVAHLLGIDQRLLTEAFLTARKPASRAGQRTRAEPISLGSQSQVQVVIDDEECCLSLLFRNPGLQSCVNELSADYFDHTGNRELFRAWCATPDLDSLRSSLDTALAEHLDVLLQKAFPPVKEEKLEEAMRGYALHLREEWLRSLNLREGWLFTEADLAEAAKSGPRYDEVYLSGGEVKELQQQAVKLNSQLGEVFSRRKKGRRV